MDVFGFALLKDFSLDRGYGDFDRLSSLTSTGATAIGYGYDDASRLHTITQGVMVATLDYKPDVGTVKDVTVKVSDVEKFRQERTTDNLGRIGRMDTLDDPKTSYLDS
ncbi:MAG: hypothetical protein WC661_10540 [Opitutaceae bacterium]|jgi:YD repeat-containing protein